MHLAMARVMRNRYRVDEADIATMRQSVAAAAQGDEEKDVGYATFFLGRVLWLHGDLAEAQEQMERALAMAQRIGESILLAHSLLGLALTALCRHDTEAVRALAPQVMAAAGESANAEFLAGAKACLTWLAWQDRRPHDVITLSAEIAELTADSARLGFYHGLVHLWPLITVHLEAGHVSGAVAVSRQIPRCAQWLPSDLESVLEEAGQAWDRGQPGLAGERLAAVVALARDLNYF